MAGGNASRWSIAARLSVYSGISLTFAAVLPAEHWLAFGGMHSSETAVAANPRNALQERPPWKPFLDCGNVHRRQVLPFLIARRLSLEHIDGHHAANDAYGCSTLSPSHRRTLSAPEPHCNFCMIPVSRAVGLRICPRAQLMPKPMSLDKPPRFSSCASGRISGSCCLSAFDHRMRSFSRLSSTAGHHEAGHVPSAPGNDGSPATRVPAWPACPM